MQADNFSVWSSFSLSFPMPKLTQLKFPDKQLFSCWRGTKSPLHQGLCHHSPPRTTSGWHPATPWRNSTVSSFAGQRQSQICLGLQGGQNRAPRAGKHQSIPPTLPRRHRGRTSMFCLTWNTGHRRGKVLSSHRYLAPVVIRFLMRTGLSYLCTLRIKSSVFQIGQLLN